MTDLKDVTGWKSEIIKADKYFDKWKKRAKRTINRYKDERNDKDTYSGILTTKYNSLWSIVETTRPALYFSRPKIIVERRYLDGDPIGRAASLILERCISYCMDKYDFSTQVNLAITDYFLTGRGVLREDYKAITGTVMDPMGQPMPMVIDEYALCKYQFWDDFVHAPARTWDDVSWIAFRSYLTRKELIERFGEEKGSQITLDYAPSGKRAENSNMKPPNDGDNKAVVWEVWYKPDRKVTWFAPGTPQVVLDEQEDPFKLSGFYPVPRPLYATLTTDSLLPIPDYWQYQDQAIELDDLTNRIAQITGVLQLRGLYPGNNDKIPELLQADAGPLLIPVDNYMEFLQNGGLEKAIMWMPIEKISNVLVALYQARQMVKNDLDNLSGIMDIAGNPNATATAQKIGSKYSALRLQEKQHEVARFLRDLLRIKGELIAEHFSPETLLQMSGYQYMPGADPQTFQQAVQLLKDDKLRSFRIEIDTDSMLAIDDAESKSSAMEFLNTVTPFMKEAIPAVQQDPRLGPLMRELLMFTARQFKSGRPLEAVIEQSLLEMSQIPAPKTPNPAEAQVQGQMQLQQMKTQSAMQETQAKTQADLVKIKAQTQSDLLKTSVDLAAHEKKGTVQ
ncbi:MAG: hypothetical protein AB7F19_07750 [Candidatus Babeliales bacterium]